MARNSSQVYNNGKSISISLKAIVPTTPECKKCIVIFGVPKCTDKCWLSILIPDKTELVSIQIKYIDNWFHVGKIKSLPNDAAINVSSQKTRNEDIRKHRNGLWCYRIWLLRFGNNYVVQF